MYAVLRMRARVKKNTVVLVGCNVCVCVCARASACVRACA